MSDGLRHKLKLARGTCIAKNSSGQRFQTLSCGGLIDLKITGKPMGIAQALWMHQLRREQGFEISQPNHSPLSRIREELSISGRVQVFCCRLRNRTGLSQPS